MAIGALTLFLDSPAGRRFISDRIAEVAPKSGLRFRVGRIEGSIFRRAILHDVRLYDLKGEFLRIDRADLDWHPFDFLLRRRLTIDALRIPVADLARLPDLRPNDENKPILPDFDIRVGVFDVQRLNLGPAVAGRAHAATINGRADVRSGTLIGSLNARALDGGDRMVARINIAPDRGDFDVNADVVAPRGGILTGLAGLDRSVTGMVRGQGNWTHWQGALAADAGGDALARLRLTADSGRYALSGRVSPALVTKGTLADLTTGGVALEAAGTFAGRRWQGTASAIASAVQIDSTGGIDLGQNRFDALRIDAWLRRPAGLLNRLDGQNVRAALRLNGAFAAPAVEYRLTAPWLSFGTTRLEEVEASGAGNASSGAWRLPLALKVARITGIGGLGERIVRNLRADGTLRLVDQVLTTDLLRVRSDGLDGRVTLLANFRTGDWAAGYDGALPGLEIGGLGRVDLMTNLAARRAAVGGFRIEGQARANVRRLDNGFLRTLTGGLPTLTTRLALGADGIVHFDDLVIHSPLLNMRGVGIRRADGTFLINGTGVHQRYGPVRVTIDGPIDRPKVDLILANPLPAAQIGGVHLSLVPDAEGFAFTSEGGSMLGPYQAAGAILLPPGGDVVIRLDRLAVGQTVASGRLAIAGGGLAGTLNIAGGGLNGTVVLDVPGGVQRAVVHLVARDASFAGVPPISVGRGTIDATLRFGGAGTSIDARFDLSGVQRGGLSLTHISGTAQIVDGTGQARVALSGSRAQNFDLQLQIDLAPDRYRISGGGRLAGHPLRLSRPMVIHREGSAWVIEQSELLFGGGRARLAGRLGDGATALDAELDHLSLSLVDIVNPDLGLTGTASGRLNYRAGAGSAPTGSAALRLANFRRAGLTDSGAALNIGVNAELGANNAAMRAVIERSGQVIGRAQARLSPLGAGGDLMTRLRSAAMTAQLRYNGDVGPLWRLTGVETLLLSGPVAIVADATGTLDQPVISGAMRASGAHVESALTGTQINGVNAVGRFQGSRLQLRNITGTTPGGGSVTGEGDFDLAATNGFAMDLRIHATNARLLERDDIAASVTGTVRLSSNGNGGMIAGSLVMNSGRFRLGRATAAEALPVINVVEVNRPANQGRAPTRTTPWQLNIAVRGDNQFNVTGLGINSDWSTDVRVRGPVDNFALLGTAELVRGEYEFAGRRFDLQSGRIRFAGGTPIDPSLDITAVSDVTGINAQIRVRGSGLHPEISFTSTPALPEDELLSRILFGSSITDISVTEAAQLGFALASLRSGDGSLDPINAIRRATGLDRLRILPANSEIGAGTSIAAGKYLTRRVFVEIITDGQGYSATRAEYQVTRWLAILGTISTLGDDSVNVRIKHDY